MGKHKIKTGFVNVLLILSLLLSSVSCSKKGSNDTIRATDERASYYYSSKVLDVHINDMYTSIYNVIPYNGNYYIVVQAITTDLSSIHNYLYCIDSECQVISQIELNPDLNIYVSSDIINDELVYVTFYNELEKVNISTGEITYSSNAGINLCGAVACDDGYVVMSIGKVDKYDSNNELVSTIQNSDWQFYNGYKTFYESNGSYYLLSDKGFGWKYYKLNFENSTSEYIYDPSQLESRIYNCNGMYIFNEDGEFLMDFENSQMVPLAKWSGMDLQPPQYKSVDPIYVGVDNETFLQVYNYDDISAQLVIYTYESDANYSDRKEIVVGGYNCKYDSALNWAIYKYNTSQSEYRIVIEDYNVDFGWDSYESAAAQKAALIQYFNNGNAPDIFYGKQFDYNQLAKNGDLIDITEYATDDFKNKLDEITPSVRDLIVDKEGKCYSIFSGYQIEGYVSSWDVDTDLSIDDVVEYANDKNIIINPGDTSYRLVSNALQFSVLSGELYSVEELEKILTYAYDNGFYDIEYVTYASMNNITVNDYLLWEIGAYSILATAYNEKECQANMVYIGFPTINGSKHVITPFGQVGISSATAYPEACTEFILHLIDEDVQDFCNLSSLIPVNDSYVQKMINYAKDHSIIPEEEYQYFIYLNREEEVSSDAVTDFYGAIESVDTVLYYDWGVENIIYEEVQSYYTDNKSISEIAESLHSRLNLYLAEN